MAAEGAHHGETSPEIEARPERRGRFAAGSLSISIFYLLRRHRPSRMGTPASWNNGGSLQPPHWKPPPNVGRGVPRAGSSDLTKGGGAPPAPSTMQCPPCNQTKRPDKQEADTLSHSPSRLSSHPSSYPSTQRCCPVRNPRGGPPSAQPATAAESAAIARRRTVPTRVSVKVRIARRATAVWRI